MDSSQIHLALTHVPVILSIVGLVVLVVGWLKRNDTLARTAFYLLLFAGLFGVPVYLTGEGAEEIVEHLPGVSEGVIEKHEEMASVAFGLVIAAAILSIAGLLLYNNTKLRRLIVPLVLLLALATTGVMAVTAHLGGQVRHTEIRSGFAQQNNNSGTNEVQNKVSEDND